MWPSVTSPFISTSWCSRPCKPYIFWKLIIWWWHWPRRRLTKRQIQRQRHPDTDKDKYKVLPRPNICYIFHKQGVQGFKILYWLSSCDDTDKDKNPILCIIRGEYFSGVNIFQGNMLRKTRRNQICFSQIETGPKGRPRPGLVTRIRRCGCGCYYSSNRKVCGRIEYECSSVYGTRGPLSV